MEFFWQDMRFGVRTLLKSRAFTVVALLTLALGIGANTTIFTLVNALLFRPLAYADPERLVMLRERSRQLDNMSVAYLNYQDWRRQQKSFDNLGAFRGASFNLTGGELPERLLGSQVSAEMFPTLGVTPIKGRVFREDEDKPGAQRVAVLSYGLWSRRFGADPKILDKPLTLNGQSHSVVGVMPPGFRFPPWANKSELWVPIGLEADQMQERGNHPGIYVVARLKPGVTQQAAYSDMDVIAQQLEKQYPDSNTNNRVGIEPLHDRVVDGLRPALLVLLGAVGCVLLIVCANVANLLLARASGRQQEIAVRTALGAGRFRIIRQLLTESALLSLLGGALGLVLATWWLKLLVSIIPETTPRADQIQLDNSMLVFTLGISLLTGLIFGLVPALQASRVDLHLSLKEGGRSLAGGFAGHRLRKFLVVAEIALSIVLLVGAGLMIKSFGQLTEANAGFDRRNVLTVQISLPAAKYDKEPQRVAFFEQLLAQLKALPGVQHAAITTPLLGGWQSSFYTEGSPPPARGEGSLSDVNRVAPDFFNAMKIPLVKGRTFTDRDRAGAPLVAIIDTTMAARHWANQDPIGKRLKFGGSADSQNPWMEVVGVVGHVKNYGVDEESRVEVYLPYFQSPIGSTTVVLRTAGDPAALAASVRQRVLSIDPDQPVYNIRTMEELLSLSLAPRRIAMILLSIFAGMAVILAAIGIYGVLSYTVTQATHEIGIRMALGAQRPDVVRLVLKQGLVLAAIGIGIGVLAALALTQLMSTLLFNVSATDPWTFAAVPVLLALVATAACLIPALRATRVDPMVALRYE